jgi:Tol biopolymer transport system component
MRAWVRLGLQVVRRLLSGAGLLLVAAGVALVGGAGTVASPGTTERVSVDSSGVQGNDYSEYPGISGDGRYVAFQSWATNLVPDDTNATRDVFVHDRETGATTRVSVGSAGEEGDSASSTPAISPDGRYVVFESAASSLVPGDVNDLSDIFVHDRNTGVTERVSVDSEGNEANGISYYTSAINADGRYVAFSSLASNLVAGDTNDKTDIFVHDRQTGATTRVSVDSAGNQAEGFSEQPAISADGRFVAFTSDAANLVNGDTNSYGDVFVHDRQMGTTERVSVDSGGNQATGGNSVGHAISADGRYVAFDSEAVNLVEGDTNFCGVPWSSCSDVFVHDRQTGVTERVSVSSGGSQGNERSGSAAISADGRYVGFTSRATNLVGGDTNMCRPAYNCPDAFVHDRRSGATKRVSVDSGGGQSNGDSAYPVMGADGRYVVFWSEATNLVTGDTNGADDIFAHDLGDADADGEWDPFDNCLMISNPDQTDTDDDNQGDACDADDDNDTILDTADNCPLVANSGQEERHVPSNGLGDHCEDADLDAFTDHIEVYVGTDPDDACPDNPGDDAWPLDVNMDTFVTVVGDVLAYSGNIGKSVAQYPELKRLDLSTDGYIAVVGDVLQFSGNIGSGCT